MRALLLEDGTELPCDLLVMAVGIRPNTVIARDIPWMVDLYEQKRLKLDELISGRFTLDQINEAIASTKSGSAKRNVVLLK